MIDKNTPANLEFSRCLVNQMAEIMAAARKVKQRRISVEILHEDIEAITNRVFGNRGLHYKATIGDLQLMLAATMRRALEILEAE